MPGAKQIFPEKFALCLEHAFLGSLQLEMIAQRGALVFGAEQTSLLKYQHHELYEILKTFVELGRHHVEAVGCVFAEPMLQRVGDAFGRTA